MDKSVWVWRVLAVIALLVFTFLFWHLYATLVKLDREIAPQTPPAEESSTSDPKPAIPTEGGSGP